MSGPAPGRRSAWTPGDGFLTLGGTLLFIDSFLHWEQICVSVVRVSPICVDFWTAWSGRGAFAGAAMAIASAGLAAWQTALALVATGLAPTWMTSAVDGVSERQQHAISVGLAAIVVVLGVVKLAFVVADHSTYGSYVAVPLLLIIAAGAAMKARGGNR